MTAPTPPAADPTSTQDGQPETKTFTQADVNRIVGERTARERDKYADYDDLKAKATQFDTIEAQNATELEKAVKQADTAARADVSAKTNLRLVRAEARAVAASMHFHDPADAAVLLGPNLGGVKVNDDGDVDETAVKALVEQLAKDKPHLVKTDPGKPQPLPGQGQNQSHSASGREQGLAEARKRFGDHTKTPQS